MVWPARSQDRRSSSTVHTATNRSGCSLALVPRRGVQGEPARRAMLLEVVGGVRDPTGHALVPAAIDPGLLLGRDQRVGEMDLTCRLDQLLGARASAADSVSTTTSAPHADASSAS